MAEYIKRDTVLQYLDCVAAADEMAMNLTKAVMKRIPAEDVVEVRRGHWIVQNDGRTRFMCSECKAKNYDGSERYCPNCGANMKCT